jgi:polar amino acid transport system permease protein
MTNSPKHPGATTAQATTAQAITASAGPASPGAYGGVTVHKRRHPGQWVATVILLLVVAAVGRDVATNQALGWSTVGKFMFQHQILNGLVVTLELSVISQLIAIAIGFLLALLRESRNQVLARSAWLYIFLFRGTPLLVQLLFWYNLAIVFPHIGIGIPFTSLNVSGQTNTIVTAFTASILALGLHEGAYTAELFRAGIVSVPAGQVDAALSVGFTRRAALRRVVLPQTIRVVIPPIGNQFIGMLKASALVSVIGGDDLLTRAENIYSVNFKILALLIVASLWYLILTSLATVGQHFLEKSLSHDRVGGDRPAPPSLRARLRANLLPGRVSDDGLLS